MARYRDNAMRKKELDMETPVQDAIMATRAGNGSAIGPLPMPTKVTTSSFFHNRSLGPSALLIFLVLLYILSPHLPAGIREYLAALRH
jgi:hypothetical protein